MNKNTKPSGTKAKSLEKWSNSITDGRISEKALKVETILGESIAPEQIPKIATRKQIFTRTADE